MAKSKLETESFLDKLDRVVSKFKSDAVLVGIPQEKASRPGDAMNNATILAINHFGSPLQNIPARPILAIGIQNAQEDIAKELKKAVLASLKTVVKGGTAEAIMDQYYNRTGIIAAAAVKAVITNQEGIEPPAESTLQSRRSRGRSEGKKGFSGESALLVTGQLRAAITYVVKK